MKRHFCGIESSGRDPDPFRFKRQQTNRCPHIEGQVRRTGLQKGEGPVKRPDIERPFKVWLYPIPPLVSLVGYLYVFASLGLKFILFGVLTLLLGVGVYLVVARKQREWPFAR